MKILLVILYTANIWHAFDMNKNIVTQKFLTEKIANCGGGGANYGSPWANGLARQCVDISAVENMHAQVDERQQPCNLVSIG